MSKKPKNRRAKDRPKQRTNDAVFTMTMEKRAPRNPGLEEPVAQTPCFMNETNGGGSFERVDGHDHFWARNIGLPGFVGDRGRPPSSKPEPQNTLGSGGLSAIIDTTKLPYRCICLLEIEYESGQTGQGTAFFVGPRTLATAGHNIISRQAGPARAIQISPGRDEYGPRFGPYDASLARVGQRWKAKLQDADDYGVLQVDENLTEHLGHFGMSLYDDGASSAVSINICGYPLGMNYATQYFQSGRVRSWGAEELEYTLAPAAGMSGAPVYVYDDVTQKRYAIAIHTYGGGVINKGRRIDEEAFAFFREFL